MSTAPLLLVTVNNAPERARRLIPRVLANISGRYSIVHAANIATLSDVRAVVEAVQPDLLCCASMWTEEESAEVRRLTKELVPKAKTAAIPHGLQIERGPDAVVEFLTEELPRVIES
ncbi:uncharacterized protein V2V93DRAFT_366022 [Kockiozyma suomiensis]|uniref:uncharacterized protein n=1 Tax=Kockiozyma suomiensis TaxID=1337062 RepID=UPI0033430AEF